MDDCKKSFTLAVFFFIFHCSASSLDTLKQGGMLNSSSYLVSARKIFTLGFYSPTDSNDSYLGILYTDAGSYYDSLKPIWVGNRNVPIHNRSGILTVDGAGNLIITHNGGDPIALYSTGRTHMNTTATLLDSGDLVVREVNPNGSAGTVLWHNFDHPTDTLLPGMKLGVNHRTGLNWTLATWLAEDVPAPGPFTLEWDPKGRKLVVRRRGVIYWTSGVLKDKDFDRFMPETDFLNYNYEFINVSSADEEYFSYSLTLDPSNFTPVDRRTVSGWRLDYRGDIFDTTRGSIVRADLCYGYDTGGSDAYGGCEGWKQPECRNRHQKFDLRSGTFMNNGLVENPSYDNNRSLGFSDCRERCWNDCDCHGFVNHGKTGCTFWSGKNLTFEQDYAGGTPAKYVIITEPFEESKRKKRIWITPAVVVPIVLLLGCLLFYLKRRRNRMKEEDQLELTTLLEDVDTNNSGQSKDRDLNVFTFACIAAATNSFSLENKLGEGGFGPVYKGILEGGQEIAVKRLSRSSGQGLVEFKNELLLITKLQHMNLVRLLGCCIHRDEKMLIYEYMPNKSLDFFIFDSTKRGLLTWERRFNIIEGIAQGLLYLHKFSRLRIIHRDLKSGNVLLDQNMNPKISDFGMARIFEHNVSDANTNRIVGTYGYMAPEYAMDGIFSAKSDVFSFGVLVLEIVSGKKNTSFYDLDGPLNLVEYAWELWNKDCALELMDATLASSCVATNQLMRCIHLGLLCVEDRALDRPTMADVVSALKNESMSLSMPKKPAFVTRSSVTEEEARRNDSVNRLSISSMNAR